jgi:predicted alpha/beta-hydrolase family hydrolase
MPKPYAAIGVLALAVLLTPVQMSATVSVKQLVVTVRGKALTIEVYQPASPPKGTVIMGSGDVGWVGLAVTMADFLSAQGYTVIGVNMRQYLSVFTAAGQRVTVDNAPLDYRAIAQTLDTAHLLTHPVLLSGMSEGAAFAVLAASDRRNHTWVDGVLTMGLPSTAELAWKWSDFTSWITKNDPREPVFEPYKYLADVSPIPLVMIQSTRDEYASRDDCARFRLAAKEPTKIVLIDARNHRFTDRVAELKKEYLAALEWVRTIHGAL